MKPVGTTAKIIPDKRTNRFAQEIFNKQIEQTPIHVSSIKISDLWELAVDHWLDYRSTLPKTHREPWSTQPDFQQRIQVNYLRHCESNYDKLRYIFASKQLRKVTIRTLHRILKETILKQISQQYPELREEVRKQLRENKKKNKR